MKRVAAGNRSDDQSSSYDTRLYRAMRAVSDVLSAEEERALAEEIDRLEEVFWADVLRVAPARDVVDGCPPEVTSAAEVAQYAPDRDHAAHALKCVERLGKPRVVERVRRAHADVVRAKNALVEKNLRLVISVSEQFQNRGLDFADLFAEGSTGLLRAVDRYDYRRGHRFSTYAVWWIRHALALAVTEKGEKNVRVPANVRQANSKIRRATRYIEQVRGREATTEEIAHATGLREGRVVEVICASVAEARLDQPNHDGQTTLDTIATTEIANDDISDAAKDVLRRTIKHLTPVEASVITHYYGLDGSTGSTLREISRRIGLTRERTRQIRERALAQIRRQLTREPRLFEVLSSEVGLDDFAEEARNIAKYARPTYSCSECGATGHTVRYHREK